LSPHLTVWRPTITYVMSIVHRITGGALYFGTVLVAWWLLAASTSERQFEIAQMVVTSWIGLAVLIGFTWAMFHHLLGGIRHLIWDTGIGMEKHTSSRLGWATLAGSILLTLLVWFIYFWLGWTS
jgi:succinate dehydrogenase / fumarate reductase cytochrome b subunit